MIIPLAGDDFGVYRDDRHSVFEWTDGVHRVVFSATQYQAAISCHFASDKRSLRKVRQACVEWIKWVFNTFDWCIFIIAAVSKKKHWGKEDGKKAWF